MSDNLEISVGGTKYQIACNDEERETVFALSQRLNKMINQLALDSRIAEEKTLLVFVALQLLSQLETAQKTNEDKGRLGETNPNKAPKYSQEELEQKILEVIEFMTEKVEGVKLAENI